MALSLDELPNDVGSLKALILAADAKNANLATERDQLEHEHTVLTAEVDRLTQQNERLDHIINVLRRAQFGRKSERISDDQIALRWRTSRQRSGRRTRQPRRKARSSSAKVSRVGASIAAVFRPTCPVRRLSSSRRPRRARAAVARCMSLAKMSPSASTKSRPSFV